VGWQVVIRLEECRAPDTLPSLVTINLAALLLSDDRVHSYLLTQPVSYWNCLGSRWRDSCLAATLMGVESCMSWPVMYTKWPTP